MAVLPIKDVVNVIVNLSPRSSVRSGFDLSMLLADSTVLSADKRVGVYSSMAEMEDDGFKPNMPEYKAAQIYFSQTSNPSKVAIGYWDSTNETLAQAIAACRYYNLEWWGCVPLGKIAVKAAAKYTLRANNLSFSINPTPHTNFRIQFGDDAVTSVFVSTGDTIPITDDDFVALFDGTSFTQGGKTFTGRVTGKSITYTADSTGTAMAIGSMVRVFGIDSQSVEHEINITGYTAIFADGTDLSGIFIPPANDELLDAALTIESITPDSVMVCTSESLDMLSQLKAMNFRRTLGIYTADTNKAAAILGWAMGANTGLANSAFTLKFKRLVGVTVDQYNSAQVSDAAAVNANVYINRGATYDMFEQGTMADGTWFDEIITLDMLSNYIQLSVMNLLTKTTKVPQTEAGVASIINAFKPDLDMAVRIGFATPGIWTAPGFLELETGDAIEAGYIVLHESVYDQPVADREARICPPIYIALKLAGAIHSVVIQINVNR